jgi:hypothetical protein
MRLWRTSTMPVGLKFAVASIEEARSSYSSTLWQLIGGTIGSLIVAVTVVLLLVRNLVPRLRSYARFATDVAAGRRVGRLDPRGSDELARLGRALDEMVSQTEETRRQEADQVEFADTLQVTASEEEAHELVQRHLQRSLPGSAVVVLKRNNSENRLEAATALVPGGPLAARLSGAEPRACLALRGRGRGADQNLGGAVGAGAGQLAQPGVGRVPSEQRLADRAAEQARH